MWINAIENKPQIDVSDKWNKDHKVSDKVVVWLEGQDYPSFARYHYQIAHWTVDGQLGFNQERIKYFMYIDNPYN